MKSRKHWRGVVATVVLLVVVLITMLFALGRAFVMSDMNATPIDTAGAVDLQAVLGITDQGGFSIADPDYRLRFPADHGPHPQFRHEWWYFTGHLQDDKGRHFGYQFTLFRFALAVDRTTSPDTTSQPSVESAWKSRQLYMAHVALTLPEPPGFLHAERFSRDALGLAGAQAAPAAIWLYDWRVSGASSDGEPPWRIRADAENFALDLTLQPGKARILQGDQGYSKKGENSASHYYSYTRLPTQGAVQVDGVTYAVNGNSWYDREWGSGALASNQTGWDWFSLQLDNGDELMWYQLRLANGGIDQASQGVWVHADGEVESLRPEAVQLSPLDYWRSPDQRCYPIAWKMTVAGVMAEMAQLEVRPIWPAQWWDGRFRYWEGAVSVMGSHSGQGYLELSGYPPQESCP